MLEVEYELSNQNCDPWKTLYNIYLLLISFTHRKEMGHNWYFPKLQNDITTVPFLINSYTEHALIVCNKYIDVQNTSLTGIVSHSLCVRSVDDVTTDCTTH